MKDIAREIVALAKELMGSEPREAADGETKITKNTVKAVLRKLGLLDKVKIDSQYVLFYPDAFSDDPDEGRDMAQSAARAFSKAMGGLTIKGTAPWRVQYKGQSLDMGDWNMPSSRWHY